MNFFGYDFEGSSNEDDTTLARNDKEDKCTCDEGRHDDDCISDYGYEDAAPTVSNNNIKKTATTFHRRSSLKTSEKYTPRGARRASISYAGEERQVKLRDNTFVRRRASISFLEKDEIKEVAPAASLTAGGTESLWTTNMEYFETKAKVKKIILNVLRRGSGVASDDGRGNNNGDGVDENGDDDDDHEMRGFEHYLDSTGKATVKSSRNMVFKMQHSQRRVGLPCEETLGKVYSHMTEASARKARQLGAQDYAQVQHEHRVTKRSLNRMRRRMSM